MRRGRRNTELGLIVFVAALVTGAYVLAALGKDSEIPVNIGPFLGFILGLLLVAHLVNRRFAPEADPILLPLAGLLNGIGYVFIARVNEQLAWQQATWTAVGIGLYCLTLIVVKRPRDLDAYRWTFALVGVGLLLMPLVPGVGRDINGARIWVRVGGLGFQPGEFAKLCLAVFFASYLVEKRELLSMSTWRVGPVMLPDPKHLGPVLLAWGVSLVVMTAQKDLGSSLLFFALFIVMLWVATQRASYLALGVGLFTVGAYIAWRSFSHVQQRVEIWLDPWKEPKGSGFQIVQAAFAMAYGGIAGTGLGLSGRINIPEAENDFIFAVIAQETGLLGATAVLTCFLLIVGSGLRIAVRAENAFDKLLATGLTALVGIQAFIIIAGVTRLLPLTGVALPFVGYGGSSLIANYVLLALLMRISDQGARARAAAAGAPAPVGVGA